MDVDGLAKACMLAYVRNLGGSKESEGLPSLHKRWVVFIHKHGMFCKSIAPNLGLCKFKVCKRVDDKLKVATILQVVLPVPLQHGESLFDNASDWKATLARMRLRCEFGHLMVQQTRCSLTTCAMHLAFHVSCMVQAMHAHVSL